MNPPTFVAILLAALFGGCSGDEPTAPAIPASQPADPQPEELLTDGPLQRALTEADMAHFLAIENEIVTVLGLPPEDVTRQGPFEVRKARIVSSHGVDPRLYQKIASRIYAAILPARLPVAGGLKPSFEADVAFVRQHLGRIDSLMQRKRELVQKTKKG